MRVGRWLVPFMVVALLATACSRSSSSSKGSSNTTAASGGSGDFGSLKNVCGPGSSKGATALGVTDSTIRVGTMSDPVSGKPSKNRMVTTITDENHHTLDMYSVPPGQKKEMKTMTIEYTRK